MAYSDLIIVAIVVLTITNIFHSVLRCRQRCLEQQALDGNDGSGNANDPSQPNQRNSDPENQLSISQLNIQMREERRLRILTGVVHKKAIAETNDGKEQVTLPHEEELSCRPGASTDDLEALAPTQTQAQHQQEVKTDIVLSPRKRSKKIHVEEHFSDDVVLSPIRTKNIDTEEQFTDNDVLSPRSIAKMDDIEEHFSDDIVVSPGSIAEMNDGEEQFSDMAMSVSEEDEYDENDDDIEYEDDGDGDEYDDKSTMLYSPKTCAICLDPYRAGDDICWSKNERCHHAFHLDCMTTWLMENDECPLCRESYLEVNDNR